MEHLADDTPCGIVVFSREGVVVSVNRAFAGWVGRPAGGIAGERIESLMTGAGRVFFQTHLFPMLRMSGRIEEAFLTLKSADEKEIPVMLNASTRGSEGLECVGAFFPVRRRSRYEDEILEAKRAAEKANLEKAEANAELRILRDELEARVEDRIRDLKVANAEMESFNYSIAHDLRTPLRAVASTSSMLIEDLGPQLAPQHRDLLIRQSHNVVRMGTLIDDLLKLSRLSRVSLNLAPLDMSQIARDGFFQLAELGLNNGCRFEAQEGMSARGDATLVRSVFQNLIENACKFSPNGGTIRVWETNGVFSVSDEGVGFDMRFAAKIFRAFERLVSDDAFEGTGIGLANVERILSRHGGKVWVESEPGRGTTVFFTLEAS